MDEKNKSFCDVCDEYAISLHFKNLLKSQTHLKFFYQRQ